MKLPIYGFIDKLYVIICFLTAFYVSVEHSLSKIEPSYIERVPYLLYCVDYNKRGKPKLVGIFTKCIFRWNVNVNSTHKDIHSSFIEIVAYYERVIKAPNT